MSIRITSFRMNFLSFSEKVRIARPLFPPSPRLRLVKNVTDTKLVKYLAKYRRFSIGSLRKTADGLYCFIGYFSSYTCSSVYIIHLFVFKEH